MHIGCIAKPVPLLHRQMYQSKKSKLTHAELMDIGLQTTQYTASGTMH